MPEPNDPPAVSSAPPPAPVPPTALELHERVSRLEAREGGDVPDPPAPLDDPQTPPSRDLLDELFGE